MKRHFLNLATAGCMLLCVTLQAQTSRVVRYSDMGNAKYVQSFVNNTMYEVHRAGTNTGLPADFHYNMADWTQRDVTEFAKSPETFDTYEILLGIANTAIEKDKDGQYTKDALNAQAALQATKPDGCKSWKGYFNMIAEAAESTQTIRDDYRKTIVRRKKEKKS